MAMAENKALSSVIAHLNHYTAQYLDIKDFVDKYGRLQRQLSQVTANYTEWWVLVLSGQHILYSSDEFTPLLLVQCSLL